MERPVSTYPDSRACIDGAPQRPSAEGAAGDDAALLLPDEASDGSGQGALGVVDPWFFLGW